MADRSRRVRSPSDVVIANARRILERGLVTERQDSRSSPPRRNFDVCVIDADGRSERNISNSSEEEYWPSWSPAGTRIAFTKVNPPATYQGQRVPGWFTSLGLWNPREQQHPVWSPDGKRLLAYATTGTPQFAIAIFDPTRDARRP